MNIALINCSTGNYEIAIKKKIVLGGLFPPLGLLYLGKILEINNHNVEVFDGNAEQISEDKIKKIAEKNDVVGLTVYSQPKDKEFALKISKIIRESNPKIKLIIGGPHVSLLTERAFKEFNADIAVRGPGETVIASLMDSIEMKKPIENLPGVCYKNNNKIIHNLTENKIENLDDLPFPARHLTDKYSYGYIMNTKYGKGKVASILTSRGCPHRCSFCGLKAHIPHYQKISVENITKEIDEIVSQGYKTIIFSDDNFLEDRVRIEKIMDHIIENHPNLSIWIDEARADSGDKTLYEKMKKAGVEIIHFGIESGNQEVLNYYNKKLKIENVKKTIKLSNKMGFLSIGSFILGAPIEKEKHLDQTLKYALSLPLDLVSFLVLRYVYGSDIWYEAEKAGKINYEKDGHFIYADSSKNLGNFTTEELINFTERAYKRFYYNPSLWFRVFFKSIRNMNPKLLFVGLKFLFKNAN
jgi:anaerobic magnesium-protoporphyrin IX monomethyl ester cyclase